jgi:hypothetical protein
MLLNSGPIFDFPKSILSLSMSFILFAILPWSPLNHDRDVSLEIYFVTAKLQKSL